MSQEWDEVVNEVRSMIMRLNAFRDDLTAAADSGELTEDQCELARDSIVLASGCWLCLLELHVEATEMLETPEEGDEESPPA